VTGGEGDGYGDVPVGDGDGYGDVPVGDGEGYGDVPEGDVGVGYMVFGEVFGESGQYPAYQPSLLTSFLKPDRRKHFFFCQLIATQPSVFLHLSRQSSGVLALS